jgi:formyltetrahydrofolate deformylase
MPTQSSTLTKRPTVSHNREGASLPAINRLLISCADRPGIVAAVSRFLHEAGANIVSSDQYSTDPQDGRFFARMEFSLEMDVRRREAFEHRFAATVAGPFDMTWGIWDAAVPKRVAVLVSRYEHCLLDILWRHRREELEADISLVISNHPDRRADVEAFGTPYEHVPVSKETKPEAEKQILELLRGNFDLVVLARYMQILRASSWRRLGSRSSTFTTPSCRRSLEADRMNRPGNGGSN